MKNILNIFFAEKAGIRFIIVMILVAVGFSCTRDIAEPEIVHPQDTDRQVNFSVRVPFSQTGLQSRSITGTEENYISSIYILSFRVDGSDEKFDYWSEALETGSNTNGLPIQNYSAVLKVRNHQQRLVLLANTGDEVRQYIEHRNWAGVEKETMLSGLEEYLSNTSGNKWSATSPSDYRVLPMWGESTPQTIINTTADLTGTIPLLRMVAKIDVQVDESVAGLTDKFRLKSVRLYNTNTKGSVVPGKDNYDDVTINGNRSVRVHTPTIPADVADYSKRYLGPVLYDDFSPPGQPDIAIRNVIYLFEAASTTRYSETTCLVVGGIYGSDSQETYYRVDFVGDDGHTLLDILRNHSYTINIIDVRQSGYRDPDDAFHSKGEDIEVSILHWDEINIDEIWFDQIYYYSVSPRLFEKQSAASTDNRIRVETDYPEWSYKISTNSDPNGNSGTVNWLTVQSHAAGEKYPGNGVIDYIVFDVTKSNVNVRTAYIHVTVGRITMTVTVKQTHWSPPTFTVTPTGTIPGIGQIRTVTAIGGTFFTLDIRAIELLNYFTVGSETIRYGLHNNSTDITIQYFLATNQTRRVRLEYKDPVTGNWVFIWEDIQTSYYWSYK